MSSPSTPVRPTRLALGRSPKRLSYERRLRLWLAVLALPSVFFASVLTWVNTHAWGWVAGSALAVSAGCSIAAMYLFDQCMRPLQTLSNVVAALREDDYSFRARGGRRNDTLGDLALEINRLASTLQTQKTSARDALTLLERVMGSLPSPVLAFDGQQRLRMANQAAEELFALSRRTSLGRTAVELALVPLLALEDQALYTHEAAAQRVIPATPGRLSERGAQGLGRGPLPAVTRWSVRRAGFRLQGSPHTLLVLADVAAALQEEERVAWQRLIRVLSHEINNSLTPIHSIAGSLRGRLESSDSAGAHLSQPSPLRAPSPADRIGERRSATSSEDGLGTDPALAGDAVRGLRIIEERAASLNRFLQAYQQMTRLPPPHLRNVALRPLLEGAAALEGRVPVRLAHGPDLELFADPDQVEHLLINLIRNAAEAALQGGDVVPRSDAHDRRAPMHLPEVNVTWTLQPGRVVVQVRDNGPGLTNPANLFVPFYTTKPNGTGVGLVLARQIAMAHQGALTLSDRPDGVHGCVAELQLPA